MGTIVTIINFLIIISVVVVVHEFGHFLFARLFKTRVDEFAIGFGPTIFKKKGKNTLFKINAIPLGGYVKLAGEDELDKEKLNKDDPDLFFNKKPWQKFFIAFSGPLFSILLGYILLIMVGVGYGFPEIKIHSPIIGSAAYEAGIQSGDIIKKVNGKYVFDHSIINFEIADGKNLNLEIQRGDETIHLDAQPQKGKTDISVILDNASFYGKIDESDYIVSVNGYYNSEEILSRMSVGDFIEIKMNSGKILTGDLNAYSKNVRDYFLGVSYSIFSNEIAKNYSEVQVDDVIIELNNKKINDGNDIIDFLRGFSLNEGQLFLSVSNLSVSEFHYYEINDIIEMKVIRNGTEQTISLSENEFYNFVSQEGILKQDFGKWKPSFSQVIPVSVQWGNTLMRTMLQVLRQLFTGKTGTDQIAGPVGIAVVVGQASRAGFEAILNLVALITINLGIFNLLPLPALDGGRIVFSIYEMITRKKVNPKVEGIIHTVGFLLLMVFAVFITFTDITRFFGR